MRRPVYRSAPWQSSLSPSPASPYYRSAGVRDTWHRACLAYSWTVLALGSAAAVLIALL